MKAKEDGDGCSPMRQCADDIADKIIKALVDLIDKGGARPGVIPDHDGIRWEQVR
jgi:hypothetical protein